MISNKIKFTIIVPTLNSYVDLKRLLKSLNAQTFCYWTLIIIDGPSSDYHKSFLKEASANDKRINVFDQDPHFSGIYGAMNQGWLLSNAEDWVFFWGSDDWLPNNDTFYQISKYVESTDKTIDLVVFSVKYFENNISSRSSNFFTGDCIINSDQYKNKLFKGFIPPHQATLFSPHFRRDIPLYSLDYSIASDLDFFLSLIKFSELKLANFNYRILNLSTNGVSGKKHFLRLKEVIYIYTRYYKYKFFVPFLLRYLNKIFTFLS